MATDIATKYPIGTKPTIHYLPYLIIISYIVSLIGAVTTVELLHRRVAGAGWRNLVQLAACSVSFGLVAIWCMHFVGNRAIILGNGEDEIQLYYSPAYTAVSAILPIIVIFLGLVIVDRLYKGNKSSFKRYTGLVFCGVCCGAAVTEMHYLGNQGTTDYRLEPRWGHVIGAAIIAIGACCVSFGLFFHWSSHWINHLWRRLLISCVLAIAVCGMHWTAAAGTTYELRGYHQGRGYARNVNLIIALCLSLSACGVCFAMGFLKQRQIKRLRDRAQQVVLAIATFDSEGRLLVTQGGLMPCQTITRRFHQRTFDDDFNTSHPVFQWVFRVSRNWGGVIDLIPSMRDHLMSAGYLQAHTPVIGGQSRSSIGIEDNSSYSATFRELFCVTAQDIARVLDTRLQDLGHLYEDVLTTGTLSSRTIFSKDQASKNIIAAEVSANMGDVEAGTANPILFGRGQLLVLTKKVGHEEANRLQNNGYRFASIDQIGDTLARSLQISREDLNLLIARLQVFCQRSAWVPPKGTYLASFLLQPSPIMKGLEVIVPRVTPDRLPMVKLSSGELNSNQLMLLSSFNGLTMDECISRINSRKGAISGDDIFLEKFRNRIFELIKEVPEPAVKQAVFSAQRLDAVHGITGQNDKSTATVFAFCGIKEVYSQTLSSRALRCVPLSFFQAQQRIYPGCPDHAILAQKNHKEFSNIFSGINSNAPTSPRQVNTPRGLWPFNVKSSSASETSLQPDSSSEKGLFAVTYSPAEGGNNNSHPFGGIMVSQEVVINDNAKDSTHLEMADMGVRSEAGVADKEQRTMADKLMAITTSFRDPHNRAARDQHNRR